MARDASHTDGPVLAVGAVAIDRRQGEPRICLIRRGQPPLQGQWSLPGGRVEWGEGLEEALRREVLEETGLSVEVGELLEIVELAGAVHHFVVLDYRCEVVGGVPRAGTDAAAVELVNRTELHGFQVTEAVARVVAKALGP